MFILCSGGICLKYTYGANTEEAEERSPENDSTSKDHCCIVDCIFSQSSSYFALCTSDKYLLIWDSSSWSIKLKRYGFFRIYSYGLSSLVSIVTSNCKLNFASKFSKNSCSGQLVFG